MTKQTFASGVIRIVVVILLSCLIFNAAITAQDSSSSDGKGQDAQFTTLIWSF